MLRNCITSGYNSDMLAGSFPCLLMMKIKEAEK